MHPILNIAIRIIRKIGKFVVQNYDRQNEKKEKKINNVLFVKNLVYLLEKNMSNTIKKSYPNHVILNNYNRITSLRINKTYWIINALNGKKNFINNIPHFCIGISVVVKNSTELSVVYDPIKNDLFTSVKGQGTQLNGYRIHCSNFDNNNLIVSTYYTYDFNITTLNDYITVLKSLITKNISIRNSGSFLLDLVYVATGKVACLFHFNKKNYNFFIGELQIRESGGLIKKLSNKKVIINKNVLIIGGSKYIHTLEKIIKY